MNAKIPLLTVSKQSFTSLACSTALFLLFIPTVPSDPAKTLKVKNCDNIKIKFEVTELDEKDKKPYTNSEKFKEMVNQNPNLEDLRSKFDLDYDY